MSVWFVTGASRGLGAAITREALSRGHQVTATARDADAVRRVFADSPDVLGLAVDVTDERQINAAVEATVERFGRIDVLVNNAGRRLVSRSPSSRSTTRVPASSGALTGTTSRSKRPSAQAAWARVWERRPNASVSARESPRRLAMRSAATYWFGMSMSQEGGRGVPASALAAVPSGTRLIASTPHAIPTPIASAAISPATTCAACCAEPHWASSVRQPVVCGSPACSQAVLVTLLDCSPAWVTQPPATC